MGFHRRIAWIVVVAASLTVTALLVFDWFAPRKVVKVEWRGKPVLVRRHDS
jgi:hypothetical protein